MIILPLFFSPYNLSDFIISHLLIIIWIRKNAITEEQLEMNYLLGVNSERQHKKRTWEKFENTENEKVLIFDCEKILQQKSAPLFLHYNKNHIFCSTENISKKWNCIQNTKLYFY